jgi:hypothetical protein
VIDKKQYHVRWLPARILTITIMLIGSACSSEQEKGENTNSRDAGVEAKGDGSIEDLSGSFEVSVHLASEENPSAPGTVGIVTWSVSGIVPESAEIRFGLDTRYGMTAPVDLNETAYRTLLLGMKPSRTYHFRVIAQGSGRQYGSADYTVETGPATNLVSPIQTVVNEEAVAPGFIITESTTFHRNSQDPGESIIYIIDKDGEVVWWYQNDIGWTSRALMSYDGKRIWMVPDTGNYGGSPLQMVSMDTLETELFEAGVSHDATIVDENTIGYIEYAEGDCGSVFEMDNAGNTVEIFELYSRTWNRPSVI